MGAGSHYDDISFFSLKRDINGYSWQIFRDDLFAAFAVALMSVPQAMAYAMLAGLPLSCGLLAAIFACIVAATFGSSRHLIIGPGNTTALLIAHGISEVLYTYYRDVDIATRGVVAVHLLTQLALMVGVLQVLAAFSKLGRLTQFVSHAVVIGYVVGSTIAVVTSQLPMFLGMPTSSELSSSFEQARHLFMRIKEIHPQTALVGIGSLTFLVLLKRSRVKGAAPVIMLIAAGLIVYLLDGSPGFSVVMVDGSTYGHAADEMDRVLLVGDAGKVSGAVHVALPYFNMAIMNKLLPSAFAIALLGVLESTSVAKSIAASSGQRLSTNQEIFGLGLSNIVMAFTSAMPSSASVSRSAVNYDSGGKTRFAAIFSGLAVALVVMVLGFFVDRIPLSALSALLLVTAAHMINRQQFLLCFKATNSDALVLIVTTLSCIFFSIDVAFYIGVVMSITLYLKKASSPQVREYVIQETGELRALEKDQGRPHHGIRIINVEGELFFGAADIFQTTLKAIAEDDLDTEVIILRLKNARDIDATACLALQQLYESLKRSGRHLVLCGLKQSAWTVLCHSGVVSILGKENLFMYDERHHHLCVQKALKRAHEILGEASSVVPMEQVVSIN